MNSNLEIGNLNNHTCLSGVLSENDNLTEPNFFKVEKKLKSPP